MARSRRIAMMKCPAQTVHTRDTIDPPARLLLLPAFALSLALALALVGCTTSSTAIRPAAARGISSATPRHNLPRHEYPFDAAGNYRTDWMDSSKKANRQVAPSGRTSTASSTQSLARTSSRSSSKPTSSSSRRRSVAAAPPPPKPQLQPAPTPAPPPPKPKPKPTVRRHTVARGETLWGISRRYGTSVSGLKSANGLSSDLIKPGQSLRIP